MLQCPTAEEKSQFVAAVRSGYITWHAGPMNLQVEMAHDQWLFEAGLDLSLQLDQRFDITRKFHVLSQRDVPGLIDISVVFILIDNRMEVTCQKNHKHHALCGTFWKLGQNRFLALDSKGKVALHSNI